MNDAKDIRLQFTLQASPGGEGQFEILAITEGVGNGWDFRGDVLKQSLSLWDNVHCFIDHSLTNRSIRDIAGIVKNPTWDDETKGIKCSLSPFGPSAPTLVEIGKHILDVSQSPNQTKIGFSADILFNGKNKSVEKIIKIYSLDLVFNPARGGAFVRSLNQSNDKGANMDENEDIKKPIENPEEIQALQAQLQEAKNMRNQMAQLTLESTLAAARLPKPVTDKIRKDFTGVEFTSEQLTKAIAENRQMLSDLTAAGSILAHSRTEQMFDSKDQLTAAVEDMFGVPRTEELKSLKVSPLQGIRELYLSLTGDFDLHGGYHPERVTLATTADFTGLVKNALNKIVVDTWTQLGRAGYDWWKNIATVEHFTTLNSITGTLVGSVSDLPAISEGGEYTELVVGDSPETASFTKYGGYLPMTLELIDRDDTRKLKAYARELASSGLRKISKLVAAIFTANTGAGPTMADTGALFNATAVTTAGGHANLLTTALSAGQWDVVAQAVYNQPMLVKNEAGSYGTGSKMAINPKFLLIPRTLNKTAREICEGSFVREATYVYDNVLKGSAVPVIVPEWTDADNWAAACDPVIAPSIYVGERFGLMPEIFTAGDELSPAVFMNDEHRLKVRHFLAVWVNDFRPLHKSNVS